MVMATIPLSRSASSPWRAVAAEFRQGHFPLPDVHPNAALAAEAVEARPPLTKGLWKGDAPDSIWRKSEETGAQLILGRRVVKVDPEAKRVTDDQSTAYD